MTEPGTTISPHYRSAAGERYVDERQPNPLHVGYRLNFDYFRPHLRASDVVLDFGCGNGGMLRLLGDVVARAEGLEVNPHAARMAKQFGHVVHSALDELPRSPRYDAIVSNHVLEHVRDASGTLERLRETLKPGGLLLLKLPLDDWRAPAQKRWADADVDHHLQTWTPLLIANVLREAGYEVVEVRVLTSAWHPRLFPLLRFGLAPIAFWAMAVYKKRRQLFVIGRVPSSSTD